MEALRGASHDLTEVGGSTNATTIPPVLSQTIDGAATLPLNSATARKRIISKGGNWVTST